MENFVSGLIFGAGLVTGVAAIRFAWRAIVLGSERLERWSDRVIAREGDRKSDRS
jgi:hypothetical protein